LFEHLVTRTSSPCVRWYASATRSLEAFEAEYGELGWSGSDSVHEPSAIEPYTSSVDTWTNGVTPCRSAASSNTCVPSTLVTTNGVAPAIERSTCDSAAKCTTASWPGSAASTCRRSVMSPLTKL
jgi:hypothetical protein